MWENHFPLSQKSMVFGIEYETDGYVFLDASNEGFEYRVAYCVNGLDGEMAQELARIKMRELSAAMASAGFDYESRLGGSNN